MDELEFRRRTIVQPMDDDPALLEAAQASPANRKHLEEMKRLDQRLHQALEIEVPTGLAERILLRQALTTDDDALAPMPVSPRADWRPVAGWRSLAMVAGVAFLLGMSTRWLSWPVTTQAAPSLAQIAMAHLHAEEPFIRHVDEQVPLGAVNAELMKYGATLSNMQELKVTYVNHCAFFQGPALHMVIQGKMGAVTLFLVPKHVPLRLQPSFEDGRLKGNTVPLEGANLVLIGSLQEPLVPLAQTLRARLHWSI